MFLFVLLYAEGEECDISAIAFPFQSENVFEVQSKGEFEDFNQPLPLAGEQSTASNRQQEPCPNRLSLHALELLL